MGFFDQFYGAQQQPSMFNDPRLMQQSRAQQLMQLGGAFATDLGALASPEGRQPQALAGLKQEQEQRQLLQYQQQRQDAMRRGLLPLLQRETQGDPAVAGAANTLAQFDPIQALQFAQSMRPQPKAPLVTKPGDIGRNPDDPTQVLFQNEPDKPAGTQAHQDAINLGYQQGTPQYNDYIRQRTIRPPNSNTTRIQVGSPEFGPVPAGYALKKQPDGSMVMEPIAGSPAATEATEAAKKEQMRTASRAASADNVVQTIDRTLERAKSAKMPVTGMAGSFLANIGGTDANDIRSNLVTIQGNVAFDKLQAMREASPTGGALGAVTAPEIDMLKNSISNVEQSQTLGQFLYNLGVVRKVYAEIVHGPGAGDTNTGGDDGWTTLPNGARIREKR